ncbi:glycerol uptake facilitator [Haematococcus lacustris]|uniref:Glycerol uptake facilitator n=1 Tax=Haematococcus lacustris TaxID=44745 RepID=A0A699Z581_HAELA|nr:glycerol uptake facilitator [Haematococcus lacustris]
MEHPPLPCASACRAAVASSGTTTQPGGGLHSQAVDREREQVARMYAAAMDQNMKLSVFTTRPAIYSPLLNFTCELMSTTVLVCGGRLLSRRLAALGAAENHVTTPE